MDDKTLIELTLSLTEKEILLLRDAVFEDEMIDWNTRDLSIKLRAGLANSGWAIRGSQVVPFSSEVPMSDDIEDGWLWPDSETGMWLEELDEEEG
jgi:hypothetical protein